MTLQQRLSILRWSVLRTAVGARRFQTTGQLGDGREQAVAEYVQAHARPGDLDAAIASIDAFAYERSFLVNVGDRKGELLDAAVRRANPHLALELGTYVGYSALRITRAAPQARVISIELSAANAEVARRIWAYAGVADRVKCVVGTFDDGQTMNALESDYGFSPGALDFVFIDHHKDAYLTDLQRLIGRGWLHSGSVVMADNVRFPGSPMYRRFMRDQQGRTWQTVEHKTRVEYLPLPDLMLESTYLNR